MSVSLVTITYLCEEETVTRRLLMDEYGVFGVS